MHRHHCDGKPRWGVKCIQHKHTLLSQQYFGSPIPDSLYWTLISSFRYPSRSLTHGYWHLRTCAWSIAFHLSMVVVSCCVPTLSTLQSLECFHCPVIELHVEMYWHFCQHCIEVWWQVLVKWTPLLDRKSLAARHLYTPSWDRCKILDSAWEFDLKVSDDGELVQLLRLWTLSIFSSFSKMLSCLYFKTQRFGDWIRSPSSGKTYSVGSNR
jgi:hypothetical protein